MADSPERPLVPPLVPAVAAAASLALVALRLAHVIGWAWQWLVSPLWGLAAAGWACVVAAVALDALSPRTILNDPEKNGLRMEITLTIAGKVPEPDARKLVRAAIDGDTSHAACDPATAVHAVAGCAIPAGWQWMGKVTEDGRTLWMQGVLKLGPLIGELPDAALRNQLEGLAGELEKQATENAKLAGTAGDGRTALRAGSYAYQECAEKVRALLAGDARLSSPPAEARCHCREQDPPHQHETDEDGVCRHCGCEDYPQEDDEGEPTAEDAASLDGLEKP